MLSIKSLLSKIYWRFLDVYLGNFENLTILSLFLLVTVGVGSVSDNEADNDHEMLNVSKFERYSKL